MRIVFMGTPDFSSSVLRTLINSRHEVIACVTQIDKAKDRGKKVQFTPVKECAIENGIAVYQPEKIRNNQEFLEDMRKLNPDIFVVVAYGKILPLELLELPKYGAVNIHASLLPRLRGASPIQNAIVQGEEKTGVTIMYMAEGMDTGDMLLKGEVEIGKMNYEELHDTLMEMGSKLILEALDKIEDGSIVPVKQDDSLATYCGLITKQDGEIDFNKSALEIERLIRGFDPWPGAYCTLGDVQVKIWKAEAIPNSTGKAGEIVAVSKDSFTVSTGDGLLKVLEIQVPGKKRVDVASYLLGHKIEVGQILKGKDGQ